MGGAPAKPDYFSVVATITTVSQSDDKRPWYEANPDENATEARNAKVTPMGDGKWRCEKNGKVFNEAAEKLLGCPAKEAERMLNEDHEAYQKLFKDVQFRKFVFKVKCKADVWEDQQRVRYDRIGVEPADPAVEAEKLMEKIEKMRLTANQGQSGNNGMGMGGGMNNNW